MQLLLGPVADGYYLFSDGSFDADRGVGVGAFLLVSEVEWSAQTPSTKFSISTQIIESKTIARLELLTLLWALEIFETKYTGKLKLFTDSTTIAGLAVRRVKLEAADFLSKRTGKLLTNADLYRKFYAITDRVRPSTEWIKGHTPAKDRDQFQACFSRVDQAARTALRDYRLTCK